MKVTGIKTGLTLPFINFTHPTKLVLLSKFTVVASNVVGFAVNLCRTERRLRLEVGQVIAMSQDQNPTTLNAGVDDSNPSSMSDMFALLQGEIKNLSANMATLPEGRSETSKAERVEGERVAEGKNNDDESWLTEELSEHMRAEDETDKLS